MTSPEKRKLNDALLLARCVEYIDGWYGIKTEDATHRSEILPPEAQQARAEMYKVLLQKSNVTKETVAVVGFKAIMSTQYPRPEVRERIVSYVPRVTERVVINDCPIGLDDDRRSDAMSPLDRIRQRVGSDGLELFRLAAEATDAHNNNGIGVRIMTNPNVTTRGMTQQASESGFKSSEVLIDLQEMFSVYPPTAEAKDFVRFCVDRSVEVGDIDSRDHLRESGKMMEELQDPNLRREILPYLGEDYRSWLAVKDDSKRVSTSGWLE